jgi:HSP20 family protein
MAISLFSRDPFFGSVLSSFPDEFSTLFDHRPLQHFVRDAHAVANTVVDVRETPEAFFFVADLPGLKREEVRVQVEGKVLSISGERQREERQDTDKWHRVERSSGKFLRQFQLPGEADLERISASAKDGVLTVKVPKAAPPEPGKPQAIDVKIEESA